MNARIRFTLLVTALALAIAAGSASAAGTVIKVVQAPGDLPDAFRPFGAVGDILISDGRYAALVAGSSRPLRSALNMTLPDPHGRILAFAPIGAAGRLLTLVGSPSLRAASVAAAIRVLSVQTEGQGVVVRSEGVIDGKGRLEITTRYDFDFDAGRIAMTTDLRNTASQAIDRVSFGLGANVIQSLSFSPYNERLFPTLNFRVYQRPDHVLGWWNANPVESSDRPLPGLLQAGQTYRMTYGLLAGTDVSDVLDRLYRLGQISAGRQTMEFRTVGPAGSRVQGLDPGIDIVEVQVSEAATDAMFYRAFLTRPATLSIPLPDGTYRVRVNAFPAVRDGMFRRPSLDSKGAAAAWQIDLPALGTVRVRLRDSKGVPVPGKVSFIGLAPGQSPYFTPENPVLSGRGWQSQKNSVYPGKDGEAVRLPAGTYLAVAARGPACTRETRVVEVYAGPNPDADFVVDKVVDTRGLVAVDAHMHTQFSDGQMTIAERLKGVAAEGVDVAVSTDHNYITDYRPEVARLGLSGELAVIVGNEVTGRGGNIHYNSYPAAVHPAAPENGAISVADSTPAVLFEMTRKNDPGAVIQVNHPRSRGLGYFLTYNLESKTAATANAPFVMNFDVMEAMNGAALGEANRATIEDWFHFLNRGYPVRVVGTSDAHGQDGGEPGYSRTYVLYDGPTGAGLDVAALMRSIKGGRSFISNGPVVIARVNGKSTYGDTLTAADGRVAVDIEVRSAPWVEAGEVRLVVNGVRREPIAVRSLGATGAGARILTGRANLKLERDAWIAVEVTGHKTLFPVVQQRSGTGTPNTAPLPYALTNPVFVDVDGDGRISPVWPEPIAIR